MTITFTAVSPSSVSSLGSTGPVLLSGTGFMGLHEAGVLAACIDVPNPSVNNFPRDGFPNFQVANDTTILFDVPGADTLVLNPIANEPQNFPATKTIYLFNHDQAFVLSNGYPQVASLDFEYVYTPDLDSMGVESGVIWTGTSPTGTVSFDEDVQAGMVVPLSVSGSTGIHVPSSITFNDPTNPTGSFVIDASAAKPGLATISAEGPNNAVSQTFQVVAGDVFLNVVAEERAQSGETQAECAVYVRTPPAGQGEITLTIAHRINAGALFPKTVSITGAMTTFPITVGVEGGAAGTVTIMATYENSSAEITIGASDIPVPHPPHPGPLPV